MGIGALARRVLVGDALSLVKAQRNGGVWEVVLDVRAAVVATRRGEWRESDGRCVSIAVRVEGWR